MYTTDTPIPEKNKNAAFSARHAVSGGQKLKRTRIVLYSDFLSSFPSKSINISVFFYNNTVPRVKRTYTAHNRSKIQIFFKFATIFFIVDITFLKKGKK